MPSKKGPCDVEGCDRQARKRQWCDAHYRRWQRTGQPGDALVETPMPSGLSPDEALRWHGWTEVLVREDLGACWEFDGTRFAKGYGQIKLGGNPKLAHRVAYEVWVGEIPDGLLVRHRCDNPPCIRPEHLETGTHGDNMNDRNSRGRQARGNRGKGLFTDDEVRQIRAELLTTSRKGRGLSQSDIAAKYNCHLGTIQKIGARTTYAHVVS